MSKRHDAIFDDVLKGMPAADQPDRAGARFLKRQNALADSAEREEKVFRWVDPADCVMWERHNRAYELLNEENCRDLIDSIRAQGRQEFPAIVRRAKPGRGGQYEVICGARRHFAISWLQANNYPQFRYLIELRDMSDEEAFRLADIENRDRVDLSDYERATDYLQALNLYYGGKQKSMAARLEVSEAWLSRYLYLARLPRQIVDAWPAITELRELHARTLRPLLAEAPDAVLAEAEAIAADQRAAMQGGRQLTGVPAVLSRLKEAAYGKAPPAQTLSAKKAQVVIQRRGDRFRLEFRHDIARSDLRDAVEAFIRDHPGA